MDPFPRPSPFLMAKLLNFEDDKAWRTVGDPRYEGPSDEKRSSLFQFQNGLYDVETCTFTPGAVSSRAGTIHEFPMIEGRPTLFHKLVTPNKRSNILHLIGELIRPYPTCRRHKQSVLIVGCPLLADMICKCIDSPEIPKIVRDPEWIGDTWTTSSLYFTKGDVKSLLMSDKQRFGLEESEEEEEEGKDLYLTDVYGNRMNVYYFEDDSKDVNLSDVNLSDVNLSDVNLSDVNLSDVNLSDWNPSALIRAAAEFHN